MMIESEFVKYFESDFMIFHFCDRVKEVHEKHVTCEHERVLIAINTLNKDVVKRIIDEMKDPGNENEAWENYLKDERHSLCSKILNVKK
ncbi:MAG: hypothetical protein JHC26_08530 [Thermofilum sp.]|nr:hypothetical protein [Thermofilum sp.]